MENLEECYKQLIELGFPQEFVKNFNFTLGQRIS